MITPKMLASRFDVPVTEARAALKAAHGPVPSGRTGWELGEAEVLAVYQEFLADRVPRPLADASTPELLSQYAQILAELRMRGVVRTSNAPLGDYAEYMAAAAYGGTLAANSAKSYDLIAGDGRRIQVKARTVSATTSPAAVFSVFRSFDFDTATLLALDARTYAVMWAAEMAPDAVREASRWSAHVRGHLLPIRAAARIGTDVTPLFASFARPSDDAPA